MTAPSEGSTCYIGRFAPSPTGPLHFGSLVAALASYLDARSNGGRWLLRVEDLDPPREVPGAARDIIRSLEIHGLWWDGEILFQSRRAEAYRSTLEQLDAAHLLYPCYCTRKAVIAAGGVYPGTCRQEQQASALAAIRHSNTPAALRVKTSELPPPYAGVPTQIEFQDLVFGIQKQDLPRDTGDFILRRKDGLTAYQLAVVVDDIAQGVTHVIRGSDLLHCTGQQIFLFRLLGAPVPAYGHIPVATDRRGQKLSKQQGAAALDDDDPGGNLYRALRFLGQDAPNQLSKAPCSEILDWGIAHWNRSLVPRQVKQPLLD